MSRLMSVAFTEQAVVERRKTVTRRKGWWEDKNGRRLLLPGDHLTLCRKVMGRKTGEPLVRLVEVEAAFVEREPLRILWDWRTNGHADYAWAEVGLEGFPGMDPADFVRQFFFQAQRMTPEDQVTRIQYVYLDTPTYGEDA